MYSHHGFYPPPYDQGEDLAMLLALQITAVVYIVAIVAFGIIYCGALRQPSDSSAVPEPQSNVIPFERGAALSSEANAPDSHAVPGEPPVSTQEPAALSVHF